MNTQKDLLMQRFLFEGHVQCKCNKFTDRDENIKALVFGHPQLFEHTKRCAEQYGIDQVDIVPSIIST